MRNRWAGQSEPRAPDSATAEAEDQGGEPAPASPIADAAVGDDDSVRSGWKAGAVVTSVLVLTADDAHPNAASTHRNRARRRHRSSADSVSRASTRRPSLDRRNGSTAQPWPIGGHLVDETAPGPLGIAVGEQRDGTAVATGTVHLVAERTVTVGDLDHPLRPARRPGRDGASRWASVFAVIARRSLEVAGDERLRARFGAWRAVRRAVGACGPRSTSRRSRSRGSTTTGAGRRGTRPRAVVRVRRAPAGGTSSGST